MKKSKIFNIISLSLIDPLRDPTRAKILFAGLIGCLASSLLCLVLNYNIAGEGLVTALTFQITRQAVMGLFGIAFSFWLLSKPYARISTLLYQSLGISLFLFFPTNPICIALGYAFVASTFWANFNVRYALQQSLKNNAHEAALAMFTLLLAGSGGTWLGGWLLQNNHYNLAVFLSLVLMALASQLLLTRFPSSHIQKDAWAAIWKRTPTSRMTLFAGALSTIQDTCMPTWFRLIGESPIATGTMLAIQPFLGLLVTPFIGQLVQKGTLRAIRVGGCVIIVAWVILACTPYIHELLLPTLCLFAIANNLIGTTEVTRWMKLRSPAGITARENLLAMGRCPGFLFALPLVYLCPMAYPLTGIAMGLLFIFGIKSLRLK